jgi:SAM-dependent methyltransferase
MIVQRSLTLIRSLAKRIGPTSTKKSLWDREFATGHWNFIDNTAGDCVYPYLEKYARNGSILDLGCGPGNTANEVANSAYQTYLGVDISEVALNKGRKRSIEVDRASKNSFELGDFISYVPRQQFDVILFRESMYHVPSHTVKPMLRRYAAYLKPGGVFVVRMCVAGSDGKNKPRLTAMVEVIDREFEVLENKRHGDPSVIVFRPTASKS